MGRYRACSCTQICFFVATSWWPCRIRDFPRLCKCAPFLTASAFFELDPFRPGNMPSAKQLLRASQTPQNRPPVSPNPRMQGSRKSLRSPCACSQGQKSACTKKRSLPGYRNPASAKFRSSSLQYLARATDPCCPWLPTLLSTVRVLVLAAATLCEAS